MRSQSTILIVDDDRYARYALQSLLAHEGYTLIQVGTGTDALRQAAEYLPDLILLDVMLPDIDGFELCKRLRDSTQLREIPILLITTLNDRESRMRGIAAGADGFISKPFDRSELLTHIRTIVRLDRYRRLLAEQARFQHLIQLSPDGIAIINANSDFLLANPALAILLGATSSDALIGQNLASYILVDVSDRFTASLAAVQAEPSQPVHVELILNTIQGRFVPVEISIGRFNDLDGAHAQLIFRDISERKRAEAQIQRQISQLTSLHAIGVAITANLDLNITLAALLDQVVDYLGVDAATVLLLNRNLQVLEVSAQRGIDLSSDDQMIVRVDEGMSGTAFLTHRPVAAPDLSREELRNNRDRLLGATFSSYYAFPLQARGEVHGVLEIMHRAPFAPPHEWWMFLEALVVQAAIAIDTAALFGQLQRVNAELTHSYDATIEGWSRALDLRDHETEGHSARVTEVSLQLAKRMNVSLEDLDHIRRGALLHDIGKMGIPDRILLKAGPLSSDEWSIMSRHPSYAYEWLAPISFLQPALAIPYSHHEKWNGTGYPRGLQGEQIPLAARVFAVVDVWDALRSNRPYRQPWSEEKIRDYIKTLSGTHFDPRVVDTFLEMLDSWAAKDKE